MALYLGSISKVGSGLHGDEGSCSNSLPLPPNPEEGPRAADIKAKVDFQT